MTALPDIFDRIFAGVSACAYYSTELVGDLGGAVIVFAKTVHFYV